MVDVIRDSGGIEVPITANLDQLKKGLEEVKRIGSNPNLIKITPQMSFDEQGVTREMNKVIRRMTQQAQAQQAQVRLFGNSYGAAASQAMRGGGGIGIGTASGGFGASQASEIVGEQRAARTSWANDSVLFQQYIKQSRNIERIGKRAGEFTESLMKTIEQAALEATEESVKQGPAKFKGQAKESISDMLPSLIGSLAAGAAVADVGLSTVGGIAKLMRGPGGAEGQAARLAFGKSIPIFGRVVGAADDLAGSSDQIAAFGNATSDRSASFDTANKAYFNLAVGRATRSGDASGALRASFELQRMGIDAQRSDLAQRSNTEGLSSFLGADGMIHNRVNEIGKRLRQGLENLNSALDAMSKDMEEQAKELDRQEGSRKQEISQSIAQMKASAGAAMGFTPTQRTGAGAAANVAAMSQRSTARWAAAKNDSERAQAREADEADAQATGSVNYMAMQSARGEEATTIFAANNARRDRQYQIAREANAIAAGGAFAQAMGRASVLSATGQTMAGERAAMTAQESLIMASNPTPLMSTKNAADQLGGDALDIRQRRARIEGYRTLEVRRDVAAASIGGNNEYAGVVGLLAGQKAELRNAGNEFSAIDIQRTQYGELKAMRSDMMRPRGYLQATDPLSEMPGGPGGDEGEQMVRILTAIDQRMQELVSQGGGAVLQ
jgi:hypothetical protein